MSRIQPPSPTITATDFLKFGLDRNSRHRLLAVSVALASLAMSNAASADRLWSTEVPEDYVTDQGTYIYC